MDIVVAFPVEGRKMENDMPGTDAGRNEGLRFRVCTCCDARPVTRDDGRRGLLSELCVVCLGHREELKRPTRLRPGTQAKMDLMRSRHCHLLPIFLPGDSRLGDQTMDELLDLFDKSDTQTNEFEQLTANED